MEAAGPPSLCPSNARAGSTWTTFVGPRKRGRSVAGSDPSLDEAALGVVARESMRLLEVTERAVGVAEPELELAERRCIEWIARQALFALQGVERRQPRRRAPRAGRSPSLD